MAAPAPSLARPGGALLDQNPNGQPPRPSPSPDSLLGVVWSPPTASGPALRELDRIHALGATAVRLTSVPTDTIFARTDSLGLTVFVDLPVSYVAAADLGRSLTRARSALDRIQRLARRHPSIAYVGLADHADTTVPAACTVLREWTARLHGAPTSLRTYYVTPFSASADRCADAVDLALLDTRARPAPTKRWTRWPTDSTAVGLGALGTWTHPDAGSGLRVPHSPERQARYLERSLSRLLDSVRTSPPVFVHRWQDRPDSALPVRRYGLHDPTGTRRPAADVTAGFYTNTQRVFAFPSGTAPSSTPYGLILLAWALVALLALLYAQSPFVRETAYRYFVAHGFYRDAIQTGRDVGPVVNTILLFVVATALGLVATVLLRVAAVQPAIGQVGAALPSSLGAVLAAGLTRPGLAGGVVGGVSAALLGTWTLGLVLAARSETPFSMGQGLMLVVWPCWPVLGGLIVALVAATRPPVSPTLVGGLLLGGTLVGAAAVTGRVLRDYRAVSGVPLPLLLALVLLSPLVVALLAGTALLVTYDLPLTLLWHLLTRT
jgi:hypothetical protein